MVDDAARSFQIVTLIHIHRAVEDSRDKVSESKTKPTPRKSSDESKLESGASTPVRASVSGNVLSEAQNGSGDLEGEVLDTVKVCAPDLTANRGPNGLPSRTLSAAHGHAKSYCLTYCNTCAGDCENQATYTS